MYLGHFGLQELPFGITPDTSFAYACASHQEALNTLPVRRYEGEVVLVDSPAHLEPKRPKRQRVSLAQTTIVSSCLHPV